VGNYLLLPAPEPYVRPDAPSWDCSHCGARFPVERATAEVYNRHVVACLTKHIEELKRQGLAARSDDTYRVARKAGQTPWDGEFDLYGTPAWLKEEGS
jgi:hypothetical protein